ncbi:MAG TPA: hypothetical protein VM143_12635 [Acidimicrobiales bacterium]|nr:hypothetical protein [Acidimicrobiales bacterium]
MQRRAIALICLALALVLVMTSCSRDRDDRTTMATTTSTTEATPTTDPTIAVVLLSGRLNVGGNALVFGAPRSQVSSYLGRALGPPRSEREQSCDAGELHTMTWPGIVAYVGDEGFAGWSADGPTFTTDTGGVRIGSTRQELLAAYPAATITESTLGTELSIETPPPGLSGILDADGHITALWSGATCVAR